MSKKQSIFKRFMTWTRLGIFRNRNGKNVTADMPAGFDEVMEEAQVDMQLALEDPGTHEISELPVQVHAERLSPREETIVRLREGFREMSDVLGNINTNIKEQVETSRGIHNKIEVLPEILSETRAGNAVGEELIGGLLKEAAESGLRQKEAIQNLRALPVALAAIQENEIAQYKALAAIKDELVKRTHLEREMADSFKKFDGTLEKIGDSTTEQAKQIKNMSMSQKTLVTGFHKIQAKTVESFQLSQEKALDDFKSGQSNLIHTFKQNQEQLKKNFLWAVGAIAAILGIIAITVFGLWMRAVNDLSEGNKEVQRRGAAIEERAVNLIKDRDREIERLRLVVESKRGAKTPKGGDRSILSSLEKWTRKKD